MAAVLPSGERCPATVGRPFRLLSDLGKLWLVSSFNAAGRGGASKRGLAWPVGFARSSGDKLVRMDLSRAPVCWLAAALAAALAGSPSQNTVPQTARDAAGKLAGANALVEAGKPEAAIPIYRQLESAFPNELSIGVNLAVAQFKAGRYHEAASQCQRLLRMRPDLFPALLFLGASQLKVGDAAGAVEALRRALSISPNDLNARFMLADALLASQQPRDASAQYDLVIHAMPDSPRAWYGLQRSYEAWTIDVRSELEQQAPASAQFLALAGGFELDRLQFARAFQLYRQALALQPTFRGLHTKLAEVYEQTAHPDWAAQERAKESAKECGGASPECDFVTGRWEQAAASTSTIPDHLYWQALAIRELALRAQRHLQQELPPSRESYAAAAEAHELRARYREAAATWKEALTLAPADSELQRRLALALCHANDCVSALPLLSALLDKAPSSAELNYLTGLALNATRDPLRALPYLEKAVHLDEKFLAAHAALGEALLEAGSPELAVRHLEASLAEDENGTRRYQLATALQAAGKHERAATVLREYREFLSRSAANGQSEPLITAP